MHIDLEQAEKAIAAARKEAVKLKTKMCIAVVDSGANLRAFVRMDDAWVGSIDIAIKKARTACFFTMGSGELGKLSQPGKPLYGIEHSNGGLITFPGGLPIIQNGELFGAIGVSGSSSRERPQSRGRRLQGARRKPAGRPSLRPHDEPWRLTAIAGTGRQAPTDAALPLKSCVAARPMLSFPAFWGRLPCMPSSSARKAKAERAAQNCSRTSPTLFAGRCPTTRPSSGPRRGSRWSRTAVASRSRASSASSLPPARSQRQGCRSRQGDQGSGQADRQGQAAAVWRARHRRRRHARRDGACRALRRHRRSRLERGAIPQLQDPPDLRLGDVDHHRDAQSRRSLHHCRQRHPSSCIPASSRESSRRPNSMFDVDGAEAHRGVHRQGARPLRRQGLAHRRGRHARLATTSGRARWWRCSGRGCAASASSRPSSTASRWPRSMRSPSGAETRNTAWWSGRRPRSISPLPSSPSSNSPVW